MFFNNIKKNQPAANVDQQSTVKSTPESTLCVELSDEELCAVNGGILTGVGSLVVVTPLLTVVGTGVVVVP
jgi:lactobin A/cerein 7B family class IIb bacteriocin